MEKNIGYSLLLDITVERMLITCAADAIEFLSAICSQPDPIITINFLTLPAGQAALSYSLQIDTSIYFLNTHGALLLQYLQHPSFQVMEMDIARSCIIKAISDSAPVFWAALVAAVISDQLEPVALQGAAWMLKEVLSGTKGAQRELARYSKVVEKLQQAPDFQTRSLAGHLLPERSRVDVLGRTEDQWRGVMEELQKQLEDVRVGKVSSKVKNEDSADEHSSGSTTPQDTPTESTTDDEPEEEKTTDSDNLVEETSTEEKSVEKTLEEPDIEEYPVEDTPEFEENSNEEPKAAEELRKDEIKDLYGYFEEFNWVLTEPSEYVLWLGEWADWEFPEVTPKKKETGEEETGEEEPEKEEPEEEEAEKPLPPFEFNPEGAADSLTRSGKEFVQTESLAAKEWTRRKIKDNAENEAMDSLMAMAGLEDVKEKMLALHSKVEAGKRQEIDMKNERFGTIFLGNPGTGKTTLARLYAKILTSFGVVSSDYFKETTGSILQNGGVDKIKKECKKVLNYGGGVLFIDEAYQLTANHSSSNGLRVLDYLLAKMEQEIGKIVVIFAGYHREMEAILAHNPGLESRIPVRFEFSDYKNAELLNIFQQNIYYKYKDKMKLEGGIAGIYVRIAIRRLAQGRGRKGFGNARTVQNMIGKISERQALRLENERRDCTTPDDFQFTKEDLIGEDPSIKIFHSAAWTKMQTLVGLEDVKRSVEYIVELVQTNYRRELEEKHPLEFSLNKVFLGGPGTGKTLVAKLYGQILADCGLLSSGEVVTKNPTDLIAMYIGQSEARTREVLAASLGKVLIIDEAYMLYSRKSCSNDSFRTGIIDTLVAECQSLPGDDRCVLLLGYEDEMREMFNKVNPGLARRFGIEDAFMFSDYTPPELQQILEMKMEQQEVGATSEAIDTAMGVLQKASRRPNFGNGGDVENLLGRAKLIHQARESRKLICERSTEVVLSPFDFDPEFNRGEPAVLNCKKLFEDVVGSEDVVERLEGYQRIALAAKRHGLDPCEEVPTTFVFKGPPGTGKTTTARKMGQVFYDMGFLSSPEVIECSAKDLISKWVGDTSIKTGEVFEKALGKVLFIDEAYRLASDNSCRTSYAGEATGEIVDLITKPRYANKIIIILAGYDKEMNDFLTTNTGLSSRFPEELYFNHMIPENCLQLLSLELAKKRIATLGVLDNTEEDCSEYPEILYMIEELSNLPFWGNGRDVKTLAKDMVGIVFRAEETLTATQPTLTARMAKQALGKMLAERRKRGRVM